ncbi:MAG: NAD-dependent epimerase/dehydratase family protein [Hyphomicrobiales bacterium]|nr:NAD-dependent epimerase/dehydratase family protein [Hyphomicrobiales bacterium]
MRILVTGGAGFIGSHLIRRLLADGHSVSVVDNESNGKRESLPSEVAFTRADVIRIDEIDPVFAQGFDAVCHIAGQVSIIRSFDDPAADLRTNTEGTLNVLQLCLKYKIPKLVYASSMTIYGDCDTVPTPEAHPCKPDSYYGITKHAAERYVHSTAERPDLDFPFNVTSLRMFSVFGPGQAWDNPYQGVLGIFLGKLQRGEPITIFGDGEQTRDFVYIGDIVEGWVRALTVPEAAGGVFNLGSGRSTSINQLAEYAIEAYGSGEHPIHRAPGRPGEQRRVQADIDRARAVLGWEPKTSFEDGLRETIRLGGDVFANKQPKPQASGGSN